MSILKKLGISFVVSMALGVLVLILGVHYANGDFIQWRSLGKPSEQITKIAGITIRSVTVETISGKLYTFDTSLDDNKWIEANKIPVDEYASHFQCNKPNSSTDIIEIRNSCFLDPGGETDSIYALKKDGNIYLWYGRKGLGEWSQLIMGLYFISGVVAGLIGSFVFFFFRWLVKLSK